MPSEKVWLITGCSSGLGQGIAEAVLAHGDPAAVTSRDRSHVAHFAEAYPGRALPLSMTLSDEVSMKQAVAETIRMFGRIDVLVNNAGYGYRAAIEESEPDKIRKLFEDDFFAPMDLIRMVLPHMREAHSGMIVNVSSIGGVRGALGNGYYSAAKGALELASEALAKEVSDFGIRVILIEPGALRTGFYDERMMQTDHELDAYDAIGAKYRKEKIPCRHDQIGSPAKAGEIIRETVQRDDAPFRLLIGSDAAAAAEQAYEQRLQELRKWKSVSVQSDF
ncbi:MAG: SDR family NAD(P)-dependent oxidoreductase [Bulleidia sp.]